ncbi:MAG: GNAT family N-acetyltransferase [Alphaproteobacteria bacterium]
MLTIEWEFLHFSGLTTIKLHKIHSARQQVFVVEQTSIYLDADSKDPISYHLTGWRKDIDGEEQVAAYLRLVPPGKRFDGKIYAEPSLGRILTAQSARGLGLGRELMRRAMIHGAATWPGTDLRMSAQRHLEKFYGEFGFETVSDVYDEDGIPHVEMLYRSPKS